MTLANRLDPEEAKRALEEWLVAKLPSAEELRIAGLEGIRSAGFSTETLFIDVHWRGDCGRQRDSFAVRVHPPGDGLFPDYDVEQECRVMSTLAEHSNVPVPCVRFHETDPGVLGSAFIVMDRIDGRTLGDDPPYTAEGWFVELGAEEQSRFLDNMLQAIAQVHAVDHVAHGLGDVGPPDAGDGALAREIAYLERYAAFAGGSEPDPLVATAIGWLRENRPADDPSPVLCWGDARPANVLVGDDLRILGAVDWEESMVASRDFDVGYYLFSLRTHTQGLGVPAPPGFPSREAVVERYAELTGHEATNVDYYERVAAVRGALIVSRVAQMMIAAGFLPPDSDMPKNNPTSHLLAYLLDLPAPGNEASSWVGKRD